VYAPQRTRGQCRNNQPERPAADSIGIDLHKRESQRCILIKNGELIEQRIVTSRQHFTAALGARAAARILPEASTESEWVARHLEAFVRREGLRIPSGDVEHTVAKLRALALPPHVLVELAPLRTAGSIWGDHRWDAMLNARSSGCFTSPVGCSASFGDTLLDVSNDEPRDDDGDNGDHQEHDRGLHCARTTAAGAPDTS
jgi:hypothetical protein